ncbi:flagellar export chaperone FliS [Paenibacillus koleovorans]|uniref:flagellar export chaperone FliS n=1 Tax=Paenibacillus koleovorans TaxID=121608 RepID=UPI000FD7AF14|nr:flagellar export chaperone FliS [Paenibacillus koleovorans]
MYQQQAQQSKYFENSIQTASKEQLLIMLYNGAIRFCKTAIEAMKQQRYDEVHTNIVKAQNIISEFVITLDRNAPVADSLLQLYDYYNHLLVTANMNKDTASIEQVIGFLTEMRDTWVEAAKLAKTAPAPAGVKHV